MYSKAHHVLDTREVLSTLPLSQYITDKQFEMAHLQEHQHKLYLFSPKRLYVFDQLGNYEKQVPLPQWKSVTFAENELVVLGPDSLTLIHLYNSEERIIPLPEDSRNGHIAFSKGELYLFSPREARVYGIVP